MGFRLTMLPRKAAKEEVYDIAIVGAGPAGITAALYSARFVLRTVLITEEFGGTLNDAGEVDDYPGIPGIPGPELAKRFEQHLSKYRVPVVRDVVTDVKKVGDIFEVYTRHQGVFKAKAIIIAVGSKRRKLGVPGEEEFAGKGVSYCAPCDAPLFKGKVVAVVGGGNAALQAALLLASYCPRVYLIHRRDSFRAFPVYVKLVKENPKIELVLNSVVTEIGGDKSVEWVKIKNRVTGSERVLDVKGIVIEIGSEPPVEFFKKVGLEMDEHGYIKVGPDQSTNVEGVFAAGDCTGGPCKKKFDQVVTAAAEGAIAALSAYEYLMKKGIEAW